MSLSLLLRCSPRCTSKTKPSGNAFPPAFSNTVTKLCSSAKCLSFTVNFFSKSIQSSSSPFTRASNGIAGRSGLHSPLLCSPIFFRSNLPAPTAKKNAGLTASSNSLPGLSQKKLSPRDRPSDHCVCVIVICWLLQRTKLATGEAFSRLTSLHHKGASIYDVRTGGGRGDTRKADDVR